MVSSRKKEGLVEKREGKGGKKGKKTKRSATNPGKKKKKEAHSVKQHQRKMGPILSWEGGRGRGSFHAP